MASRQMMPLLLADCVGKSFRGRRVLTSASLRGVPGELRALLGRNGAGKSTLLKIAAGWLRADTGMLFLDGEAWPAPSLHALARCGVFYLPDHDLLSDAFTVRMQLEMLKTQFGGSSVDEAHRMGVAGCLGVLPATLSGGERRRVELAAVFVRQPRCQLADEPFRGVSPLDAEVLATAFRDLAACGTAIVVTGHEVPTLMNAADHVTWCTNGTTYELGAPRDAWRHARFAREYLGSETSLGVAVPSEQRSV